MSLRAGGKLEVLLEKDDWPLLTDHGRSVITKALRARFGEKLLVGFEQSRKALCSTLSIQDEARSAANSRSNERAMQEDKTAKILRRHFDAQFIPAPPRLP